MKICVAQTKPVKGNIESNIDNHQSFIDLALSNEAEMIIFPELSITGYEPTLSKELATTVDDSRFDVFQKISDEQKIIIGIGVPTKADAGICITMVLFHPHRKRQWYSKKYLHADEEEFFASGQNTIDLLGDKANIALAICYELSVVEHAAHAAEKGARIYIASVAKSTEGVEKAIKRLSEIADQYKMTVLMSNCIGVSDGFVCGGKSSVWNNKGILMAQLNSEDEGIIIFDTDTEEAIEQTRSLNFAS